MNNNVIVHNEFIVFSSGSGCFLNNDQLHVLPSSICSAIAVAAMSPLTLSATC